MRGLSVTGVIGVWTWAAVAVGQPSATRPATTQPEAAGGASFCFLHVANAPVRPGTEAESPDGPGFATWVCAEAGRAASVPSLDLDLPGPAFILHTGDVTAFGGTEGAWAAVEKAFASSPVPVHFMAGPADNAWNPIQAPLRRRAGADYFSFDRFGCHFVGLPSTLPQQGVACIDSAALYWLRTDLAAVNAKTPVILFMHHPPDSPALAQPASWSLVHEFIANHNVVLVLHGEGQTAAHRVMDGIDTVSAGSSVGPDAGYNLVSVQEGTLRVVRRFRDAATAPRVLLEKPLTPPAGPRLSCNLNSLNTYGVRNRQAFALKPQIRPNVDAPRYEVTIDGVAVKTSEGARGALQVPAADLDMGGHVLCLRATDQERQRSYGIASSRFYFNDLSVNVGWVRNLPASVTAAPVTYGDPLRVIVGETGGALRAIRSNSSEQLWEFDAGGPIIGSLIHEDDAILFGSGDGHAYCVAADEGQLEWKYAAGCPVYGIASLIDETVYIGDVDGRLHAIDMVLGERKWLFEKAGGSIECRPAVWGDLVVFTAWDGFIYAVNRKDGSLAWKTASPGLGAKEADGRVGPGDCSPLVRGERILVCDATGLLYAVSQKGKLGEPIARDVAAIAPAADGEAYYVRATNDRLVKRGPDDKPIWETAVPTGRLPVPPTEANGRVYVCSDTGRLSVLDAAGGEVLWRYRATHGFYVFAPVTVDRDGAVYILGGDGSITRLLGKMEPRPGAASKADSKPAT